MLPRIDNPISKANLDKIVDFLSLKQKSKVIDLGCGRGEFLLCLAEKYNATGTGIDISESRITEAKAESNRRKNGHNIRFTVGDVQKYQIPEMGTYDLVGFVGSSYYYGSFKRALQYAIRIVHRTGKIIIGHPYWYATPTDKYCKDVGDSPGTLKYLHEYASNAMKMGLNVTYVFTSSRQEYDHYFAEAWRDMKLDMETKSLKEQLTLRKQLNADWIRHLKWIRNIHGWAIYIFEKNG